MTAGPDDPAPGSGVENLELGPSRPRLRPVPVPGPALIAGLTLLGTAVLALVGFVLYGLVVGGTATAQGAADAVVDDLNDRDLRGLYQLLEPHEREAYARAVTGLTRNARQLGLGGDVTSGAGSGELGLDGVDLRLTGVQPTVQKLAPDVALLLYATGDVTATVRPAETTGLLRLGLDAARIRDPITRSRPVAELVTPTYAGDGDGPGVGLIAIRSGLRWYVSPAASAAWIGRVSSGETANEDVRLTPGASAGWGSAHEAAEAGVTAALTSTQDGTIGPFAATLVRSEQVAAEIYAAEAPEDKTVVRDADEARIDEVRFADGPRTGNRQLANLEELEATTAEESLHADATCLTSGSIRACATDPSYGAGQPIVVRFFSSGGSLGMTAREDRGGWRVSLADTLADGVVSWSAGLSREQAVALLGLTHLEPSGGPLRLGRTTVSYNAAAYAVRTLTVPRSGRYVFGSPGDDFFSADIYPTGSGPAVDPTYDGDIEPTYSGQSYRLVAGDYVVVLSSGGQPRPAGQDRTETVVVRRVRD